MQDIDRITDANIANALIAAAFCAALLLLSTFAHALGWF